MTAAGGNGELRIVLCAGQGCAERESCARYRVRGGEFPWASFDKDRMLKQHEGKPCPAYIEIRQRKQSR